jgi:hypothetical protein
MMAEYSMVRRRVQLVASSCVAAGVLGVTGVALADGFRKDWDCPGTPRQPCYNDVYRSWGSATAVNTANPYAKCSVIREHRARFPYDIARLCGRGYTVRTQSDDAGQCAYPNNAPVGGSGRCSTLSIRVGNDTDVRHGLRGVGYH